MTLDHLHPIIHWLSEHPNVGIMSAFLITFLESIALFGLLIPGSVFMTALGTLAGSGTIPIIPTLLWGAFGAFLGDSLSFAFGYRHHKKVPGWWPFCRFPKLFDTGKNFFQQHGKKSVFLGRFIGPVRPILPLMAGMMHMPIKQFLITDMVSALLWAPAYMCPGILLGMAAQTLPPKAAKHFIIIVILTLLALWILAWIIRLLVIALRSVCDYATLHCWQIIKLRGQSSMLYRMLYNPMDPNDNRPLRRLLVGFVLLIMFVIVTWQVCNKSWLTSWDLPVFHFMQSFRSEFLIMLANFICLLGQKKVIIPTFGVIVICLIMKRHWRDGLHWLAMLLIPFFFAYGVKRLAGVIRPETAGDDNSVYSFPSGHVVLAMALFGWLAIMIANRLPKQWRWVSYLIASVIVISVGLGRLYLGDHWLTDVVGSIFLVGAIINFVSFSYHRHSTRTASLFAVIGSLVLGFTVASSLYVYSNYANWKKSAIKQDSIQTITMQDWWENNNTAVVLRQNRFGKPVEMMNVEWLGDIAEIKQQMQKQGWHLAPPNTMTNFIGKITAKNGTRQMPLLPQLYQNHQPVLILFADDTPNTPPLVLQLWQAPFAVLGSTRKLYFGKVELLPIHRVILHKKPEAMSNESQIAVILQSFVNSYTWKLVNIYPSAKLENSASTNTIPVIYIKDKLTIG